MSRSGILESLRNDQSRPQVPAAGSSESRGRRTAATGFVTSPRGRDRPPNVDRAPSGRRLRQPEHAARLCRRAPPARRLARRPRARRCESRRLPPRAPRRGPRLFERLDGGRRGVLPREARRPAHSCRRTHGSTARRLPADRLRSRPGPDAAVWGSRTWRPCSPPVTDHDGAGAA